MLLIIAIVIVIIATIITILITIRAGHLPPLADPHDRRYIYIYIYMCLFCSCYIYIYICCYLLISFIVYLSLYIYIYIRVRRHHPRLPQGTGAIVTRKHVDSIRVCMQYTDMVQVSANLYRRSSCTLTTCRAVDCRKRRRPRCGLAST